MRRAGSGHGGQGRNAPAMLVVCCVGLLTSFHSSEHHHPGHSRSCRCHTPSETFHRPKISRLRSFDGTESVCQTCRQDEDASLVIFTPQASDPNMSTKNASVRAGECPRLVQNATLIASSALDIFEFIEFWTISNDPSLMKSSGFRSLRREKQDCHGVHLCHPAT